MQNPINKLQTKVQGLKKELNALSLELEEKREAFKNLSEKHSILIDENIKMETEFEALSAQVRNMCNDCIKQGSADCQDCPLY